jgi:hypothetical protein
MPTQLDNQFGKVKDAIDTLKADKKALKVLEATLKGISNQFGRSDLTEKQLENLKATKKQTEDAIKDLKKKIEQDMIDWAEATAELMRLLMLDALKK